ncbi:hypothetical protein CMI47_19245 [Candidatus Pacearchaeota archaeon]|nr:hypothetical protein [Candidatus Pacearchaeota archaeon]
MKKMFKKMIDNLPLVLFFTLGFLVLYTAFLKSYVKPGAKCYQNCIPLASEVVNRQCWCRLDRNTMKLHNDES